VTDVFAGLPGALLPWYEKNRRDLPWRADREPYHVWLSEIMLQQTRVEAARSYYLRFLAALPSVADLAAAGADALHKLWEGLGYYSRVRNLHAAAQRIEAEYGGVFPSDYASVRALPGVGDYTAGAVCSICFGLPTPAVDGNVLRVCARLTEDASPVTDAKFRARIAASLAAVYPAGRCGDFTQSLMELGALVCLPNGAPRCDECPCAAFCAARAHGTAGHYPVRPERKPRREEKKTVFLLRCGDRWAVRKRPARGLLAGLWEFPNLSGTLAPQEALDAATAMGAQPRNLEKSQEKTHVFTHVFWHLRGYTISCAAMPEQFSWATEEELERDYALPTAFRQFRSSAEPL